MNLQDISESKRKTLELAPKVYVANFGERNTLWPQCLAHSHIKTINEASSFHYVSENDKSGFIINAVKNDLTARGVRPSKTTASRWYNVSKIFETTSGDIWIHRCDDDIWWTISLSDPYLLSYHSQKTDSLPLGRDFVYTSKPTMAWSRTNLNGKRLSWKEAHPKARYFLTTEATLHSLSKENAEYALALIMGDNLANWHDLPKWKEAQFDSKRGEVSIPSAKEKSAYEMALTAWNTTKNSNDQIVEKKIKNKNFCFSDVMELSRFVRELIDSQEGRCAISDLLLQYQGSHEDAQMLCSLDRIDSDGHYERDNLQVVCRFINRWKSNSQDEDFRRLLNLVRNHEGI